MVLHAPSTALLWVPILCCCIDHSKEPDAGPAVGQATRSSSRPLTGPARRRSPALAAGGQDSRRPVAPPAGKIPDTKEVDGLLGRIVRGGKVDYGRVAAERAVLDRYLEGVAAADLTDATRAEKLAFYINAYNAEVLVMVLKYVRGKGPKGKDLAGVLAVRKASGVDFFHTKELLVGGELMSLDDLEKRGRALGDPRIHFAVNCASISCPPLAPRAYRPATLDADLDAAVERYLASPQGLRIRGRKVYVSSLLDWYAKDFGGAGGVTNFLMQHAPDRAKEYLDRPVGFLDYDWRLNGKS